MQMVFDISQDELPIFLAEVDEHLQTLDETLVELEHRSGDADLLQNAFRAAHTLKGMSGMIGHHRMTNLTHALETAFDGLRKGQYPVTTALIDLCLDAVDGLRALREEVINGSLSDYDPQPLIEAFADFTSSGGHHVLPERRVELSSEPPLSTSQEAPSNGKKVLHILAQIDPRSVASAARAFQLMMALQELGEISTMQPSLEQIETAQPVQTFQAQLLTTTSKETVLEKLGQISEIQHIEVRADGTGQPVVKSEEPAPAPPQSNSDAVKVEAQSQAAPANQPASRGRSNGSAARGVEMTVRTSVERLDSLMNLVGELITDRNHLFQVRNKLEAQARNDPLVENLAETVAHISRITDQLQEEVMRIRMLPIGNLLHKFPRMVRDMSQKAGKLVDVVIHGEDTELDRSMIEEINDPLIHLVRNAIDHGIEPPEERRAAGKPERGTVTLNAWHEQGRIILTVSDDGRGIDPAVLRKKVVQKGLMSAEEAAALSDEQAVDLIFLPGFSTAEKVTDISGRGVGMDIVQTNIQRVNGTIHIETAVGRGTTFQIVLPLTLAIVPTLLVRVGPATFAIPLVMVLETLRLSPADIKTIRQKPVTMLRGSVLPLIYLSELYNISENGQQRKRLFAVVIQSGKHRVGLVVDGFMGEEEVVVKSLGKLVGEIPGISSAAILGDGSITLIVDVPALLRLAGIH
ncbi:MAG: chemotaxis protein CheA [Bellilinea sp.]|nr:chemotaxis protein CheA [Bellilinea sp.]